MPKKQAITNKQFQKFLVYVGCSLKRAHGDHFIYVRSGLLRPIVIPKRQSASTVYYKKQS